MTSGTGRSAGVEVVKVPARPRDGRAMTIVQSVLLGLYVIGTFGTLLSAVVRAGDPGAFLDPGLERLGDPKDSLPIGPAEVWNPLLWLFGISRVIAVYAWQLPPLGVLLGVISLVAARGRSVRAAAFTAAWVVLAIVVFSPYGSAMYTWLID